MVIYEPYSDALTRAYSDAGMMIERDGIRYEAAIDPASLGRTYTETEIPIYADTDGDADVADYVQALRELGIDTEEAVST